MMNQQPLPTRERQLRLLLNVAVVGLSALLAWLLVRLFFGYGTVRFDQLPASTTIRLNGHTVPAKVLRLRPGDYHVLVASPLITPYQATLHVGLWKTINYHPPLLSRSPDAIASSLIGSSYSSGPVHLLGARWFDNNTWLVGYLDPSLAQLAVHYSSTARQWSVAYYSTDGYPHDLTKLPDEVAAYVQLLGQTYVAG